MQKSAKIICSIAPEPPSFLKPNILLITFQLATIYPTLNAGANDLENDPQ